MKPTKRLNYPPDSQSSFCLAWGREAFILRDGDGRLSFIDKANRHLFQLRPFSYNCGLQLLGQYHRDTLRVIRGPDRDAIGFAVGRGAALLGLFSTEPRYRPIIPLTTQWLATPQGLHQRDPRNDDWTTVLWHPHLRVNSRRSS